MISFEFNKSTQTLLFLCHSFRIIRLGRRVHQSRPDRPSLSLLSYTDIIRYQRELYKAQINSLTTRQRQIPYTEIVVYCCHSSVCDTRCFRNSGHNGYTDMRRSPSSKLYLPVRVSHTDATKYDITCNTQLNITSR